MITATMRGSVELRRLAAEIQRIRVAGLRKELRQRSTAAFRPLQREIKAEAARRLPSGYGPIMARSVKVSVSHRGASTIATVYGRGRAELRDVRAINAGRLRHPTFGRRHGKGWVTQAVRPGFVTDPADRLGERIVREGLAGLDEIVRQIATG